LGYFEIVFNMPSNSIRLHLHYLPEFYAEVCRFSCNCGKYRRCLVSYSLCPYNYSL